jgi:phosphoglycolate phosphatase
MGRRLGMINIILFDLDGTISDPKIGLTKSFQYALKNFGIDESLDELTKLIGPPIRPAFKHYYGFDDEGAEKAVEKFRERFLTKGLFENTMYDGMDIMLQKLAGAGKTLMIATSKPIIQAKTVLSYFKIDKYFTYVSGSEMNGDRSEKSEVIQYALEQNNINDLSRCIMVGDRKHDIIGAKTAGIKSVGVLYGYGSYDELSEANADYIVKDVDELSDLLCNC